MKNKNFIRSLRCASKGLLYAVKTERNLQFDISVMFTVVVFASAYGLDRVHWAVLSMIFTAVICAELFNTALEKAVDTATKEYSRTAGAAKDISAAAVLVCAAGAATAGIIIFGDCGKIFAALGRIYTQPVYAVIFSALLILDAVLILTKHKNTDNGEKI